MNEFSLIKEYFKDKGQARADVIVGVGDDAACLEIPSDHHLLVSTDTLVENIHFLPSWRPYDIAWRSLMVNISDIIAAGGKPCWISLALTLPDCDPRWLEDFSRGLDEGCRHYNIALIGGDTTRGPLTITITIHGLVPKGQMISRAGASPGDLIWVTGPLGAAAMAISEHLTQFIPFTDQAALMDKLLHPTPRVDFQSILQHYATAAIDISDGLSADLNHICVASQVGACLTLKEIPIDPTLLAHYPDAINLALTGGDDYELCFTTRPDCRAVVAQAGGYVIGHITEDRSLWALDEHNNRVNLIIQGYQHFK